MEFIDAHHHLWAPKTPELDVGYVWLKNIGGMRPFGDPTPIQRDYLLDELRGEPEGARMIGSVHLQCDPRIPDPVAETAFIQKLSDDAGFPIAIVGYADFASGSCAQHLEGHMAYPNFRGIRQIISYLPDDPAHSFVQTNLLDDLTWRSQFGLLADYGLSFDLMLYPHQMRHAAAFFADHPDIPVVLEHLGSPLNRSEAGMKLWAEGMQALAALPHVHAKLSGYAMYFRDRLDDEARMVTQRILEWFGPDRVMFGSNFPVDRLYLTYNQAFDLVREELGGDVEVQRAVFRENAARFYRLDIR
ncbi:amidohydrolase [Marimonas sp. MJW-29]|uniref:Amidohydrolase n=1 Tax=Sulfitobacter sediminis TaxID=3234186 RepID=A0ABV3RRG4_9RHOB